MRDCYAFDSRWRVTKGTEGVGFEPTVGFPTLDFESSALNRTQPPFLDKNKTSNVQGPTSNDRRKYDRENPVCEEASGSPSANSAAGPGVPIRLAGRGGPSRQDLSDEPQKCYNFRL